MLHLDIPILCLGFTRRPRLICLPAPWSNVRFLIDGVHIDLVLPFKGKGQPIPGTWDRNGLTVNQCARNASQEGVVRVTAKPSSRICPPWHGLAASCYFVKIDACISLAGTRSMQVGNVVFPVCSGVAAEQPLPPRHRLFSGVSDSERPSSAAGRREGRNPSENRPRRPVR